VSKQTRAQAENKLRQNNLGINLQSIFILQPSWPVAIACTHKYTALRHRRSFALSVLHRLTACR
jgi:hypothetical protein